MEKENAKVKKMHKGLIIGIAAAVVVVVVGIIVGIVLYSSSMSYVAKVDGLKVSNQEYLVYTKRNMNNFLSSIPNNTATVDKYDWNTKINGQTVKDQIKKDTLNEIQGIKIILVKAKEAGITLSADDLKNLDSTILQNNTKADMEKAIKSAFGLTYAEYKDVVKDEFLRQKYVYSERSKVKVSDDEVKKQYDNNKADYDKVTVTHILISTVDSNGAAVSEGKKKEAKQKADDLLKQVQAGGDIKALAVKYSDDKDQSGKVNNNGEYTFSKTDNYVAEFKNWAFEHKVGDSGVVETQYGYHVMKLEKRDESKFDDVKESIKNSLTTTKLSEDLTKKMDAWMKETQFAIVKNTKALDKADNSLYVKK